MKLEEMISSKNSVIQMFGERIKEQAETEEKEYRRIFEEQNKLNEMASQSALFYKKSQKLIEKIMQHWCLVRYFLLEPDRECTTINHWKTELKTFMQTINHELDVFMNYSYKRELLEKVWDNCC